MTQSQSQTQSQSPTQPIPPFHLAIPVHDVAVARAFYRDVFGFEEGRSAEKWVDFNFFGHQVVIHQVDGAKAEAGRNGVDGDAVPVPHFGVVLDMDSWRDLRAKLEARDDIDWIIAPRIRFEDEPGEQAILFIRDPSGNALEFKAFADLGQLFATD